MQGVLCLARSEDSVDPTCEHQLPPRLTALCFVLSVERGERKFAQNMLQSYIIGQIRFSKTESPYIQ